MYILENLQCLFSHIGLRALSPIVAIMAEVMSFGMTVYMLYNVTYKLTYATGGTDDSIFQESRNAGC